jgi:hypothetical protein
MHTDLLAMWFTKLRHSLGQAQLPKFFWFQLTRSEGSSVFSHGSETSKMMSRAWCTDGWGCSICSVLESRLAVRDGKRLHITSQKVVWRFGNCNWSISILDGVVLQTSGSLVPLRRSELQSSKQGLLRRDSPKVLFSWLKFWPLFPKGLCVHKPILSCSIQVPGVDTSSESWPRKISASQSYSMQLKSLLRTRRYPSLGQSQTKRKPVCRRQDAHLLTHMVGAEVFD